jgi:hypothetical protein
VLGSQPGGNWVEGSFSLTDLLVTLRKYNNAPIIDMYVFTDVKNTNYRIIYVSRYRRKRLYISGSPLFNFEIKYHI